MKGYEIAYSDDEEDDRSVYSAWSEEEDSSESETDSEVEYFESRQMNVLKIKNWEESKTESLMSSYQVNPGTFVCDYCLCHEKNGLPMFCEESKKTYHKECFIAEARRKTKNGLVSQLVEQEYEEYFSEQKEKEVETLFQEIMEPSSSKIKEEIIDEEKIDENIRTG